MWFASNKEVRRMIEIQTLIATIYILYYSFLEKSGLGYMDKILEVLPRPDLGIYLDVDIDVAIRRINKRTGKERAPYEKKMG